MFGTHLDACTRYRNTATGRIDYAKVHAAEHAALRKQDEVLQNLSVAGVMTINTQDHDFFKPLPKLGEIKKRRRRGGYSGGKYSARDVERAAETDMIDMLEYSVVRRASLRKARDKDADMPTRRASDGRPAVPPPRRRGRPHRHPPPQPSARDPYGSTRCAGPRP
ncbi:hypothetical protein BJY59DRAFT_686453 [Rhodotorula toruloides]